MYYEYRIAEAITLNGQVSDQHLANEMNVKFNAIMKTENVDYILAADTDSIYVNCDELVKKAQSINKNLTSIDKIVDFLDGFGDNICQKVVNDSVDHIFEYMNAYDKVMKCKREAIASKVIYRKKKNYAMYIHNSEGVSYNPPKIKVLGLEIVRSSTPQWCRDKLKDSLKIMFESEIGDFQKWFMECKKDYMTLKPEEIAFPRGVNDIGKWIDNKTVYKKRCPINVRASILYNKHISDDVEPIQEGDKIKFLYLKMPNPIGENVIGFPTSGKLPENLGLHEYIDYPLQFSKTFEEPLSSLSKLAGWSNTEQSTLEEFF